VVIEASMRDRFDLLDERRGFLEVGGFEVVYSSVSDMIFVRGSGYKNLKPNSFFQILNLLVRIKVEA